MKLTVRVGPPSIERPQIRKALHAVQQFEARARNKLTTEQQQGIGELKTRIRRAENTFNALMNINDGAIDRFREKARSIMSEAAPELAAVSMNSFSVAAGFNASLEDAKWITPDEKLAFEEGLEGFYLNVDKTKPLVRAITGDKRYDCPAVTSVRNKLIEHRDKGDKSIHSFGISSYGPTVRPLFEGEQMNADAGLIPNAHEWVNCIVHAFS